MNRTETDYLILGGGVGGIVAANRLRKYLPTKSITLIDKSAKQGFQPSYLWIASGARNEDGIVASLSNLPTKRIGFIEAEIAAIKAEEKTVRLITGDEVTAREGLVIALGAELRPELVSGLSESGHSLYSLEGSVEIDRRLGSFQGGNVVVLTAEPAYKCPAAPYEAALLIDHRLSKAGVRSRTKISVFAAEPAPMGTAGPNVSEAVKEMLRRRDIAYFPEHKVTKVDKDAKRVHFENGQAVEFELLVFIPPHRIPKALEGSALLGPSGWISVDKHTLATSIPGVYAVGDVTSIPLSIGKPLPKAGIFAHAQAEVVAYNLAHPGSPKRFDGHGACFIETGHNRAGMGNGDFYAEPSPKVSVHEPALWWHLAKVLYEKRWLRRWY